jgi:tetratricopeptide (TPR) repeat protein
MALKKSLALPKAGRMAPIAIGAAIILVGVICGAYMLQTHFVEKKADAQLQKGFGALAAETLDSYRFRLRGKEKSCRLMIAAYYQARRLDRLEWAAQACLESGLEMPEAYLGLATVREMTGREGEALQLLNGILSKFEKIPDIYYEMAQILRRNKKDNEAAAAYMKASERAPENNQFALETLQYLTSLQKWPEAHAVADRLKNIKTDNPEVKLFVARVLLKGGDKAAAEPLIAAARELINKKPESKAAFEKSYPELLGGQ